MIWKHLMSRTLAFTGLLAMLVLLTPLSAYMTSPLVVSQDAGHRQTVVVLSAGVYDAGLPDFQTMTRMLQGLELYRTGQVRQILCLGGGMTPRKKSYAQSMAELYAFWGVPWSDLRVHDTGGHTRSDLASLFKDGPEMFAPEDAVYVTSDYHTLRLRLLLDKFEVSAPVVSADSMIKAPNSWVERIVHFKSVVREYGALAVSKILGWI